jgi:hypothetical protein
MRTELFRVPEIITVDENAYKRDLLIRACTQNMCQQKYGNAECRVSG